MSVRDADRERFELHAAPEAIKAELERARRELLAAIDRRKWLETLAVKRQLQIARGEWPPKRESGARTPGGTT